MKTKTVTATDLKAGDEIYIDGRMAVATVEEGTEPTFRPGETVMIIRGTNPFGASVAKWAPKNATFRVSR